MLRFNMKKSSLAFAFATIAQSAIAQNEMNTPPDGTSDQSDWKSDKLSLHADIQHYDWKSDAGASGRQTVLPLTATYRLGNTEYGLRTAWIESVNTTPGREGKVSTMSDAALSVAYTQRFNYGWGARYNFDWNIPTGKSTLSGAEKNAIMDGNIVSQTRFGEGTNITPGVVFTKVINSNTSTGFGFSHTIRGSYDPNGDAQNDKIKPGNETRAIIQGQYNNQEIILTGGLIYTQSKTTQVNGIDYFQKGSRIDLNIIGTFHIPNSSTITTGIRYGTQRPDTYTNSISGNFEKESFNINGKNTQLSFEYSKKLHNNLFKLYIDWLNVSANSYDQINDLYNAGREKYSYGLGYNYMLAKFTYISIDLKKFKLKDKATPATLTNTIYTGFSNSIGISHNF